MAQLGIYIIRSQIFLAAQKNLASSTGLLIHRLTNLPKNLVTPFGFHSFGPSIHTITQIDNIVETTGAQEASGNL